tara:strand:- start:188 stop:460 length:273 start_codon:yes stop_codon:yes gene_type:complete
MSVQANTTAYCHPRDDAGPYTQVEIGFPSMREDLLVPFAESPDSPTNTIYGWVPAQTVINVIAKHGGMIAGELPRGFPYIFAVGVQNKPI